MAFRQLVRSGSQHLRQAPVRVLEIGSWEGRSALFFLNYFPAGHLVCVDTFGGSVEHHLNPYFAALVPETERKFDANTAAFAGRFEKRKGPSSAGAAATRHRISASSTSSMSTAAIAPPMFIAMPR